MVDRLDGEVLSLLLLLSKLTFALLVDRNEEDDVVSSLFILFMLSSAVFLWCILYFLFVDNTDCVCFAIRKLILDIPWCWKAGEDCILLASTLSADDCIEIGILVVDDITDGGNTNDSTNARMTYLI